jgi:hypothetical protein
MRLNPSCVPTRIFVTFVTGLSPGWWLGSEFPEAVRRGWDRSTAGPERASPSSGPNKARTKQPSGHKTLDRHVVPRTKFIRLSIELFGYL